MLKCLDLFRTLITKMIELPFGALLFLIIKKMRLIKSRRSTYSPLWKKVSSSCFDDTNPPYWSNPRLQAHKHWASLRLQLAIFKRLCTVINPLSHGSQMNCVWEEGIRSLRGWMVQLQSNLWEIACVTRLFLLNCTQELRQTLLARFLFLQVY